MRSVNKVMLIGNLGSDPELKSTNSGTTYALFNLATTVEWENADGKTGERTDWHRIVVWGRLAEKCSNMLRKGSLVHIEGKLQTRSWQDNDGVTKYITEIVAQNITSLDSMRNQVVIQEEPPPPEEDDIPF